MVFIEAVRSVEDMKKVNAALKAMGKPSLANMIEGGLTPILKASELQKLGYSAVGYPCGAIFSAVKAVERWGSELLSTGTSDGGDMLDFE